MKLTCKKRDLLNALSIVTRAITSKVTMPILSCVRYEATVENGNGVLKLTATNLDTFISTGIPAQVKEPGSLCLSGRRLIPVISELAGESIDLESSRHYRVTLLCPPSRYTIMGLSPEEFPQDKLTHLLVGEPEYDFDLASLNEGFRSTKDAASDQPDRWSLGGVRIAPQDGCAAFVATDGRRLHFNLLKKGGMKADGIGVTVPSGLVGMLLPLLEGGTAKVQFRVDVFRCVISRPDGEVVIVSKSLNAGFPEWKKVAETVAGREVTVEREAFRAAVHRIRLALDEKSNSLKIAIRDMVLSVSVNGKTAEAVDDIVIENPTGLVGEVALNSEYLLSALSGVEDEKVRMLMNHDKPSVSPVALKTDTATMVIMPVRLE